MSLPSPNLRNRCCSSSDPYLEQTLPLECLSFSFTAVSSDAVMLIVVIQMRWKEISVVCGMLVPRWPCFPSLIRHMLICSEKPRAQHREQTLKNSPTILRNVTIIKHSFGGEIETRNRDDPRASLAVGEGI